MVLRAPGRLPERRGGVENQYMNVPTRLTIALAIGLPLCAQVYPGGRGGRGMGMGGTGIGPVVDAVASFDGVFKTADKKFLEIQVESGDVMRMYITGKTKFVLDGKVVKSAAFHDGDKVIADATRDSHLNLLAVKVENKKPTDSKPAESKPENSKEDSGSKDSKPEDKPSR